MSIASSTIKAASVVLPWPRRKLVHLPFLDGLRGVMALWVACGHAFQDYIHVVDNHSGYAWFLPQPFFQEAFFAHFAVDVFIVLSGFCLMMPVARTSTYDLPGGWSAYLKRRAMRILPPYYAALTLAALLSLLRWLLTAPGMEASAIQAIDFRPSAIAAHLLLVQNMWDPWARSLDGPTWSVATEFQIYILFPLLLLPLWRRIHPAFVVLLMSVLGIAIYFWTPYGLCSCSWYMGLFSMGMYAADWYVSGPRTNVRKKLIATSSLLLGGAIVLIVRFDWMPRLMWALDLLVGAATALLLAYLASDAKEASAGRRALEWQPLVNLGTFSYSFYLIHAPLLNVAITFLLIYDANGKAGATTIVVTLILVVIAARGFYALVERPSMSLRLSNERKEVPSTS